MVYHKSSRRVEFYPSVIPIILGINLINQMVRYNGKMKCKHIKVLYFLLYKNGI